LASAHLGGPLDHTQDVRKLFVRPKPIDLEERPPDADGQRNHEHQPIVAKRPQQIRTLRLSFPTMRPRKLALPPPAFNWLVCRLVRTRATASALVSVLVVQRSRYWPG